MRRHLSLIIGCLAALTVTACTSVESTRVRGSGEPSSTSGSEAPVAAGTESPVKPVPETQVTGVVLYRERIALTPEAVVHVEVVEWTPEGTAGAVLGEQTLRSQRQVPIPFEVSVPAERVRPEGDYVMRARITDGTRTFSTPTPVPVLTHGNPSSGVQVLVRPGT